MPVCPRSYIISAAPPPPPPPQMGISATVIDPADLGALERALEEHKVSLFFSESPTNPVRSRAGA